MEFDQKHLDVLKEVRRTFDRQSEERGARTGAAWFAKLGLPREQWPPGIEGQNSKLNREELFALVSDPKNDTATICAAILAWGGMRTNHGKRESSRSSGSGGKW